MEKTVAIFLHMQDDQPGYISDYLSKNNISHKLVRLFNGDQIPDINEVCGLVFMGGTMSVNDGLDWLNEEIALIKEAVKRNIPILGHCLGGQLISVALGAKVISNPHEEIGWHYCSKETNEASKEWLKGVEDDFLMFHWHTETFDLPSGAKLLFSSDYCDNQAFIINHNILAMQCHVEMTESLVEDWAFSWRNHLKVNGKNIQSYEEIIDNLSEKIQALNKVANILYDTWVSKIYDH